jgi:hypothetical protein
MDPSSAGVQFEISPEIRAELLKAGVQPAKRPQQRPLDDEPPEEQPDQR